MLHIVKTLLLILCVSLSSQDIFAVSKVLALSEYGLSDDAFDTDKKKADMLQVQQEGYFLKGLNRDSSEEEWFSAGQFETYSIKRLRELTKKAHVGDRKKRGRFNIVMGNKPWQSEVSNKKLDIGAMLADPAYEGATFQVASNFNALEGSSVSCMPLVQDYVHDNTQGPRASIACLAATLLRKYYAFYNAGIPAHVWSQELGKREVNFLAEALMAVKNNTRLMPSVSNGYLDISRLSKRQRKMVDAHFSFEEIHIGLHRNTQVMWGYNWTGELEKDGLLVNQVFTAAMDLGGASGSTNYRVANDESVQSIARKILFAAYEGTIRASLLAGSEKVVLTLVGGGVFHNDPQDITDAIMANEKIIRTSGLEVTLVVYDKSGFVSGDVEQVKRAQEALNCLTDFAGRTGGRVTEY